MKNWMNAITETALFFQLTAVQTITRDLGDTSVRIVARSTDGCSLWLGTRKKNAARIRNTLVRYAGRKSVTNGCWRNTWSTFITGLSRMGKTFISDRPITARSVIPTKELLRREENIVSCFVFFACSIFRSRTSNLFSNLFDDRKIMIGSYGGGDN